MADFILSGFADEADSSLDLQIEVLRRGELSYVEMRGVDGSSLIDSSDEKVAEIKEKLNANQIHLSSVGSYIGKIKITDEFAPHLDKFKRAIEIAQKLQSPNIRIFSFFLPTDQDPSIFRDEVMERMTAILDAANGSGVNVCHENEKDIYGDIPLRVLDLHQTLGPRLKGIFDPANYIQCNVKNISEAMKVLLQYIEYLHVKDSRLSDHHVVPAGFGDGQIQSVFEMFSMLKGQKFLSVEPHLAKFIGYEGLGDDTSIKNGYEFVYETTQDSFLAAVSATKNVLSDIGYHSNKNIESGIQIWTK